MDACWYYSAYCPFDGLRLAGKNGSKELLNIRMMKKKKAEVVKLRGRKA